ncbi:hypothetical protein Zmor_006192 [Zophobas morio]|uniref:Uncharacterized protein n=1 Tax=Zophobas morio TaxID=2755281 RepID=A0AA38ITC2_9CUCU|nr:hypothetical protein Zmor_006192 [Zophobas morio]
MLISHMTKLWILFSRYIRKIHTIQYYRLVEPVLLIRFIMFKLLFFFALLAIALALPKPAPVPDPQWYTVGAVPYAAYYPTYGWGAVVY